MLLNNVLIDSLATRWLPALPNSLLSALPTAQNASKQGNKQQPEATCHWEAGAFPLSVLFTTPHKEDLALLAEVLNEWSGASMGTVRFRQVGNGEASQAAITIEWTSKARDHNPYMAGVTTNAVNEAGLIYGSHIALLDAPLIDQQLPRFQQRLRLRATLLHELGHALGLEHSSDPSDVMYYRGWRNAYLSERDAQQIQRLYPEALSLP